MKYLKKMARALALKQLVSTASRAPFRKALPMSRQRRAETRERELNRLTAYFLFTTFNEALESIQRTLQMPMIATEIITVADEANLPLQCQDGQILNALRRFNHEEIRIRASVNHKGHAPKSENSSSSYLVASLEASPAPHKTLRSLKVSKSVTKTAFVVGRRGSSRRLGPAPSQRGQASKINSISPKTSLKFADLSTKTSATTSDVASKGAPVPVERGQAPNINFIPKQTSGNFADLSANTFATASNVDPKETARTTSKNIGGVSACRATNRC
jgi:hypothetical protein